MNAKEKAIEIIESFYNTDLQNFLGAKEAMDEAKQCAIIHVNGIIEVLNDTPTSNYKYSKLVFYHSVLKELNQM